MSSPRDDVIYKFIRIPIPIGTAGALIWAVATFVQRWDPAAYPDLKTVFQLFWMQLYAGIVTLSVAIFYLYLSFDWARLALLRHRIRVAERRHTPPAGMVLVPAGKFQFRLPRDSVYLGDYFIDEFPVTNEQYAEFVKEAHHPAPTSWGNGHPADHKSNHPVTDVTWKDAKAYCRWRSHMTGKTVELPTEEEWEKAARGPYGHQYPWGNKLDLSRCNVARGDAGGTSRVDAYPRGVSPYRCWDMCGNVWEWTDTWFSETKNVVVLKGGSYYFDVEFAPSWIRYQDEASEAFFDLGFRCVVRL
jgi:formylglycine-generating enzyme required for sulfatase activity